MTRVSSVLAQKCKASPSCFQGYVDQVWEVLEMTEALDLEHERQRVVDQIAPHVAADTHRPYDAPTVARFQNDLYWFIDGRRRRLTAMLP